MTNGNEPIPPKLADLLKQAEGIQLDVQIFRPMNSQRVHVISHPDRCQNPVEGQQLAQQILEAATREAFKDGQ